MAVGGKIFKRDECIQRVEEVKQVEVGGKIKVQVRHGFHQLS
ncbi:hypothetical protein A2U01_0031712 [Trifolium medium]|uniref:Uncharacterized protein n=1 Tax=Trifolium medium TaxID=97028 RepID=A0A392PEU5_9FABA|nr:hypothetical protein [Trifolium medium]